MGFVEKFYDDGLGFTVTSNKAIDTTAYANNVNDQALMVAEKSSKYKGKPNS